MSYVRTLSSLFLAAAVAASACVARADEAGDQLKSLMDKYAPSIVTVKLVIRAEVNFMGQSRDDEQRAEVHGVVVDPEGLIMVPATAISGDSLGDMLGGGDDVSVKMTPTDIKIVVGNEEKEFNGFLAAVDSKVGLAFLKIEDLGDRKLTAVDFGTTLDAAIGQAVAQVGRHSKGYDYACYFESARVSGEIAKPRKAWMVDGGLGGFALPVFTAKGEIIGVLTNIADGMKGEGDDGEGGRGFGRMMRMLSGSGGGGAGTAFVLPGSIVKGLIGQAKTKSVEVAAERAKQKEEDAKSGGDKKDEEKKDEEKKDGEKKDGEKKEEAK